MTDEQKKELNAAIQATLALADAIKELGSVPSGTLYANVMGYMTLAFYERAIDTIVASGMCTKKNNLLTWTGK